ncbi:hypothetical protein NDU88_003732 [Pleurodeles waltl]|uniref:Uncharacterized protein n=1 Tax=Pleurodeles waltl TaxID=8319 RepID=A0AAV7MSH3_PLEWA|nr:hypothetical protein NDU88_003732 [Pleurodeles waltl]
MLLVAFWTGEALPGGWFPHEGASGLNCVFASCVCPVAMGKSDLKQIKLAFEGQKRSRQVGPVVEEPPLEDEPQLPSVKAMFMNLKNSLVAIDTKLGYLTDRMDRMKDRVDCHDTCLEQVEARVSD